MIDAAEFLLIDAPAMATGALAALACALVGNFLVLRRQALIGDAMSHVVLPGIVVAFWVTGTISAVPMLLGALVAALIAAGLIETVRRLGRMEPGAAMGVVFTVMFAVGVLLLEQSGGRDVHLDVQHALYGNVESTLWIGAEGWRSLVDPAALAELPRQLVTLAVVTAVIALLIWLFFKELRLATFDPGLATALGFPAHWINLAMTVVTAAAAVAAFEAVGSILVIAMFICPPATARMLTDRLATQVWLSAAIAIGSGVLGYTLGAFGLGWLGLDGALNAAGMIAVVAALAQVLAMLFAPRHGVVAKRLALRRSARRMAAG